MTRDYNTVIDAISKVERVKRTLRMLRRMDKLAPGRKQGSAAVKSRPLLFEQLHAFLQCSINGRDERRARHGHVHAEKELQCLVSQIVTYGTLWLCANLLRDDGKMRREVIRHFNSVTDGQNRVNGASRTSDKLLPAICTKLLANFIRSGATI
jgi:hypothetical protein